MKERMRCATALGVLALALTFSAPAWAAVSGRLIVDGKAVQITHAYAYARQGFFDPKKQDVTVVLCDAELSGAAVRNQMERLELVKAGKLHCVEQTIDAGKRVINFDVQHQRFKFPESGGSTEQVFEATTFDGKTIAGRSYTKAVQKSFDNVPYSYDVTYTLAIAPMK